LSAIKLQKIPYLCATENLLDAAARTVAKAIRPSPQMKLINTYFDSPVLSAYCTVVMTIPNIASEIHELTKAFNELPTLAWSIAGAILAVLAALKKVIAAWPQKMSSVGPPSVRRLYT